MAKDDTSSCFTGDYPYMQGISATVQGTFTVETGCWPLPFVVYYLLLEKGQTAKLIKPPKQQVQ